MHWIFVLVQKDRNTEKEIYCVRNLKDCLPSLPLKRRKSKKKIKVFLLEHFCVSLEALIPLFMSHDPPCVCVCVCVCVWANPTVMVIQQWSKQSFQPHHPGVSETPRLDFFFLTNLLGKR